MTAEALAVSGHSVHRFFSGMADFGNVHFPVRGALNFPVLARSRFEVNLNWDDEAGGFAVLLVAAPAVVIAFFVKGDRARSRRPRVFIVEMGREVKPVEPFFHLPFGFFLIGACGIWFAEKSIPDLRAIDNSLGRAH